MNIHKMMQVGSLHTISTKFIIKEERCCLSCYVAVQVQVACIQRSSFRHSSPQSLNIDIKEFVKQRKIDQYGLIFIV
jgi:hypothetical protein